MLLLLLQKYSMNFSVIKSSFSVSVFGFTLFLNKKDFTKLIVLIFWYGKY